jgi:para-aminobenzoate synthetase / 4-amino-4-deoxychorismate lyase
MPPMTPRRKPDPRKGIFETVLVVRGEPVAAAAHLERLDRSLRAVYGKGLPAGATEVVARRAANLKLGRLRLTVVPSPASAEGFELEVDAGELDRWPHFPPQPVSLVPHQVDGGLGSHKWADRASLPDAPAGEAPLLVDGGEVLEAAWANVFAVRRGALFTPPLDGRILPGVTRATTIELAHARGIEVIEGPLSLAELRQATEVFLTNSIRGIELVGAVDGTDLAREHSLAGRGAVDGTDLAGEHSLAGRLAEALRARWKSDTAARRRAYRIERVSSA